VALDLKQGAAGAADRQ